MRSWSRSPQPSSSQSSSGPSVRSVSPVGSTAHGSLSGRTRRGSTPGARSRPSSSGGTAASPSPAGSWARSWSWRWSRWVGCGRWPSCSAWPRSRSWSWSWCTSAWPGSSARARRRVAFHEAALDRVRGTGSAVASPARASSIRIIPTPPISISSAAARCSSASAPRERTRARTCSRPGSCGMRRSTPCARARRRVGRAGPARRPARGHGRARRRGAARGRLEDARGLGPGATRCGARGPAPRSHSPARRAALVALLAIDRWGLLPFYLATAGVAFCGWRARPFSRAVLAGIGRPVHDLAGARRDLRSPRRRAVRVAPPGGAAHGALRRG